MIRIFLERIKTQCTFQDGKVFCKSPVGKGGGKVLKIIRPWKLLKLSCLHRLGILKAYNQRSNCAGQNWRQDPNITWNIHTERWIGLPIHYFCSKGSRPQTTFSVGTSSSFRLHFRLLNGQCLPRYSVNEYICVNECICILCKNICLKKTEWQKMITEYYLIWWKTESSSGLRLA